MASASIRNITNPRKASIDVMRVVDAATDGVRLTDVEAAETTGAGMVADILVLRSFSGRDFRDEKAGVAEIAPGECEGIVVRLS
jgi:hypothetical protein